MRKILLTLATGFGAGYFPKVPGTAGTAVGVILYFLLKDLPHVTYGVTLAGFVFLSVWVASIAESHFKEKDSRKIVIDEIAGYLVTMALVQFSWGAVAVGFVLFRLLDIWKPFPGRWIEKRWPAGWGIVGDDVMVGVYANLVLQVVTRLHLIR